MSGRQPTPAGHPPSSAWMLRVPGSQLCHGWIQGRLLLRDPPQREQDPFAGRTAAHPHCRRCSDLAGGTAGGTARRDSARRHPARTTASGKPRVTTISSWQQKLVTHIHFRPKSFPWEQQVYSTFRYKSCLLYPLGKQGAGTQTLWTFGAVAFSRRTSERSNLPSSLPEGPDSALPRLAFKPHPPLGGPISQIPENTFSTPASN